MEVLMDELVEEIFLRLSPEEPAHMVRAALVCRSWCRMISDRSFRRRYHAFHRQKPPLLGYFQNIFWPGSGDDIPRFVHTCTASASPISHPALDCTQHRWRVLDCRHGRVLLLIDTFNSEIDRLVVWDPMTGDQQRLSLPAQLKGTHTYFTGAVLCAKDGDSCDHLDCHGGPFTLVFISEDEDNIVDDDGADDYGYYIVKASMYSSETQEWRDSNTVHVAGYIIDRKPSLLAGGTLYFTIDEYGCILKYDLGAHCLSVVDTPDVFEDIIMTTTKAGRLRVVADMKNHIYVWTKQHAQAAAAVNNGGTASSSSTGSAAGWVKQRRAIKLEKLLAKPSKRYRSSCYYSRREVVGYAEGTDTIFIDRDRQVFTLDLRSRQATKVGSNRRDNHLRTIYPYMGFYTPDIAKGRLPPLQRCNNQ